MSNLDIKTIYDGVPKIEEMKHYVDLRNIIINSRDDLVKVCQIFRNPKYETFRIIYMRDDKIANYETITSRLPNNCDVFRVKTKNPYLKNIRGFEEISRRMYRLGANGYYLQHNHPSGNAKASIEDMIVTNQLDKNVEGFKGHIIVNHGTYSWIEKDAYFNKLVAHNNIQLGYIPDLKAEDMIQKHISSRSELAELMYKVKHSKNYSCLVLTSAIGYIRLLQEIPNTFINMSYRQIGGYIKNRCVDTGSTRAFLSTTDKPFFERARDLVNLGYVSDCVAYTITNDKAEIIDGADKKYIDQNIFESIRLNNEKRKLRNEEKEI